MLSIVFYNIVTICGNIVEIYFLLLNNIFFTNNTCILENFFCIFFYIFF